MFEVRLVAEQGEDGSFCISGGAFLAESLEEAPGRFETVPVVDGVDEDANVGPLHQIDRELAIALQQTQNDVSQTQFAPCAEMEHGRRIYKVQREWLFWTVAIFGQP